jgi:hypothetical protein
MPGSAASGGTLQLRETVLAHGSAPAPARARQSTSSHAASKDHGRDLAYVHIEIAARDPIAAFLPMRMHPSALHVRLVRLELGSQAARNPSKPQCRGARMCMWDIWHKLDKRHHRHYIASPEGRWAMPARQMRTSDRSRPNVADRVAVKVANALKGDTLIESGAVAMSAQIAGTAVAMVASLTAEARNRLSSRRGELTNGIRNLLEVLTDNSNTSSTAKLELDLPRKVETKKGAGLGKILSEQDGQRALSAYAFAKRLEDWAGPVAGATELSRDYGIPRSTLNRWQHLGDVIGLLKGTQKHVYPTDQFVDGRPAKGIAEVNAIVSNPRVAWLWLSRGNAALRGKRPIDLLKHDRVGEVVDAARAYFGEK